MENFRKIGPKIKGIEHVRLPHFSSSHLDNGTPLYTVPAGTQDIIKLELVFSAGRPFEHKKVSSRACNSLLKEGTHSRTSKEISDEVDFYGATLRTSETIDTSSISLFCLGKHFEKLMPIVKDVISDPLFLEDELRKYVNKNTERLKIELIKNDVIAYRKITEAIFTSSHPYGYNSEISDYKALTAKDLRAHYERNYGYNNGALFLSGMVNEKHIELCNDHFGVALRQASPQQAPFPSLTNTPRSIHVKAERELQTAIKIGRRLFERSHQDYPGMYFLNAVLGGYFGSRLMSNIREDKGYTYNIYSEVDVLKHDGLFLIGTEVSDEHVQATVDEIKREISRLKEELIPEQELAMVRNYLLGRILNFIDGPFNTARLVKSIKLSGLDTNYFDNLINIIKNITAEELRNLALKYFRFEEMWMVTVGKVEAKLI